MNKIHPSVIITGNVELGSGNEILPYSVLIGPIVIGDNNYIGPHVTIGTPGQDTRNPRYDSSSSKIRIGSSNIIREYTAIQKPCYGEITSIGDGCFLMQSVHVPHDAVIDDDVVITPMVVMGGLCRIMKGANLGISSSVHQYGVVGPYAIVGMGATATKNVKPFSRHVPGKPISVNHYAIKKFGLAEHTQEIERYVLHGEAPAADCLLQLVHEFEQAHAASNRAMYE